MDFTEEEEYQAVVETVGEWIEQHSSILDDTLTRKRKKKVDLWLALGIDLGTLVAGCSRDSGSRDPGRQKVQT